VNLRMTATAAIAVVLAALSLNAVIAGNGWLGDGICAVIFVAAAGLATRLSNPAQAIAASMLALIGVSPLLAGTTWGARIAGIVIVVLVAASATGVRLLRGFAIVVSYLAGLLIFLNLAFTSSVAYAQVIPSTRSLVVLGHMVRSAFSEFRYAPPVPDTSSVSLVAAAGIGLIAILVDIIAVRMRRPAVAGLPLLLLFSVPVASDLKVFGPIQVFTFALGLAGYLALLSTDGRERLRMWGRLVTFRYVQSSDEAGLGPDTRQLAASGRRIGLAATCLAVIVPLIFPAMRVHDIFGTTSDGADGRGSLKSPFSALLSVQDALTGPSTTVFTYTTNSPEPAEQYFQQYVLNYNVNQNKWLVLNGTEDIAPTGSALPFGATGVTKQTPTVTVTTKVHMSKYLSPVPPVILPVPYAPAELTVPSYPSGWREEPDSLLVYNNQAAAANLSYTVVSKEADPKADQISAANVPPAIYNEYGSYTGPNQSQLYQIAVQHDAGTTPLEMAVSLQDWFTSGAFRYTLKPDLPSGSSWLLTFLTKDRRGFCVQFAWAFAILARLAGIPSRVVIGYTAGTPGYGPDGSTWLVTSADAHAWPELYFDGVGWLRFEPTPGGTPGHGQGTAETPQYAAGSNTSANNQAGAQSGSSGTGVKPTGPGSGKKPPGNNRFTRLGNTGGGVAASAHSSALGWAIGIPVALFLLIAWPCLTRLVVRRRRWLAASDDAGLADAAWRELTDDLADYGLTGQPGDTPRAVATRVAEAVQLDPAVLGAVGRIRAAEERARYARTAEPGAGLAADVGVVRRAVASSVSVPERIRARLLPASTLAAAWRLLQRAGDMFGWLDVSWPVLRRQLRQAVLHRSS
jgi:transglutaminase-like putative cysteine protease